MPSSLYSVCFGESSKPVAVLYWWHVRSQVACDIQLNLVPMCETNDLPCSKIWAVVNNCYESNCLAIMPINAICCRIIT